MTDATLAGDFLASYRELWSMFSGWVEELAGGFDDGTALVRPHETLNHAAWIVGHITWLSDCLLAELPSGTCFRNQGWDPLFKIGAPRAEDGAHPPFGEIVAAFKEVREKIAERLESLRPEDLAAPLAGGGDWIKTPFDAMLHALRDGNYHLGQLSTLHKLVVSP